MLTETSISSLYVAIEGVGKTSTFPHVLWKTKMFLGASDSVNKTVRNPKKKIKAMMNLDEISLFMKISPEVKATLFARFHQLDF
jgi:hypothetical protein